MDHVDAIRRESELFYATALVADAELGVPSCPGWTIADLVWHLGEVHWFWTAVIEQRASDPAEVEKTKPARPRGYGELLEWGRARADRMIRVLENTSGDVSVWTWALDEADHSVAFIRRHQVQEAAIHRWDMQSASTQAPPDAIAPEVGSDSIDEFLAVTLPWSVNAEKPLPGSVHLHSTDTTGEWIIHRDGQVEPVHTKGDVAVRGTASDLLLALYERVPIDALELIGDAAVARQLVERVNTE